MLLLNIMINQTERTIRFRTIHEDNPTLKVKLSKGLTALTGTLSVVDQLTLPNHLFRPELESPDLRSVFDDGFHVTLHEGVSSGYACLYDPADSDKLLLKVSFKEKVTGTKVKLVEIADGYKSTLFKPLMGGGVRYVLVIGKEGTDCSDKRVQQLLPFGRAIEYRYMDVIQAY